MKNIFLIVIVTIAFASSCGEPKGPGKEAGKEANSDKMNNNDYPSKSDTTIDMNSGGGVGPDVYKTDSLAKQDTKSIAH